MALAAVAAPKRIIAAAALVMVACAIFGSPVTKLLSAGGFTDPASESARAADILASKFSQSDVALLITVTADGGVHSTEATQTAADILAVLKSSPDAIGVTSLWTAPQSAAPALTSKDGKTGVITAGLGAVMLTTPGLHANSSIGSRLNTAASSSAPAAR